MDILLTYDYVAETGTVPATAFLIEIFPVIIFGQLLLGHSKNVKAWSFLEIIQ